MFAIGQQQSRTDVRQHGVSSLDGLAYVYGDVGTLRQQDAQDGGDLRGSFVEKQGDRFARPAAGGTQVASDGHGPGSELTVVPFACAAQQSRALGKIQCVAAEATMQVAQGQGGIAFCVDAFALQSRGFGQRDQVPECPCVRALRKRGNGLGEGSEGLFDEARGKTPLRTSQSICNAPLRSVTWQSSQTWGVWVMP